jgi:hypothetical protein
MSQLHTERDRTKVPKVTPSERKPDVLETADKRMADRAEEVKRALPIEDDEMPA